MQKTVLTIVFATLIHRAVIVKNVTNNLKYSFMKNCNLFILSLSAILLVSCVDDGGVETSHPSNLIIASSTEFAAYEEAAIAQGVAITDITLNGPKDFLKQLGVMERTPSGTFDIELIRSKFPDCEACVSYVEQSEKRSQAFDIFHAKYGVYVPSSKEYLEVSKIYRQIREESGQSVQEDLIQVLVPVKHGEGIEE